MPRRRYPIRQSELVRRFAERLREVRLSRGMTQAVLAREANVTSSYLSRLEAGNADVPSIAGTALDGYLSTHLVDPALLRADDFDAFYEARQDALLRLIEEAMGRTAYRGEATNEPEAELDAEPEIALAAAE